MKSWEWVREDGLPIFVGIGDPANHWNCRHQFRNRLTAWLCQHDTMPEPCTRWHLKKADWQEKDTMTFARARMRQIRAWSGEDCLLNRAGGPLAHVSPDGSVRLHGSSRDVAKSLGISHVEVVFRCWRGGQGLYWDDLR